MSAAAKPSIKGRVWLWLLFLLNAAYLCYELAYNSRLVDSATEVLDHDRIHVLEMAGRFLSASGFCLLLLRIVKVEGRPLRRIAIGIALVLALGFPAMFYGQRILVDQLVDSTTAEQRQDAQYIVLMKRGLASNAIQLDQISLAEADLRSAHTRSLISILGLMTYFSPDFVEEVKNGADGIIAQLAETEARKGLPEAYAGYQKLQDGIETSWTSYTDAVKTRSDAIRDANAKADEGWVELNKDLLSEWEKIAPSVDPQQKTRNVLAIQRSLAKYFKAHESCNKLPERIAAGCLVKVEEVYTTEVVENAGRYIAPTDWCRDSKTVSEYVRKGTRFVETKKVVQDCDDLGFEHLTAKLDGFVDVPDSFQAFLVSPKVSTTARQKLADRGVVLPSGWTPADRDGFRSAVVTPYVAEAEKRIAEAMTKEIGTILPLDLDSEGFLASAPVQDKLREKLKPLDASMVLRADYSPDDFLKYVTLPHYVEKGMEEKASIISSASDFADGAKRESEGKSYVRALIVPPIAMGFSLFFALFNLVGLAASVPTLLGSRSKLLPVAVKVGGLAALVVVPMIASRAVIHTQTYEYLNAQASASLTPATAFFATWAINTEPAIHPVGAFIADRFDFMPELPAAPVTPKKIDATDPTPSAAPQPSAPVAESEESIPMAALEAPQKTLHGSMLDPNVDAIGSALELYGNGGEVAYVDLQSLKDDSWVVHRKPAVNTIGTCLTNHRDRIAISEISDVMWQAVRYGDCKSMEAANKSIRVPTAFAFANAVKRQSETGRVWAHFQPTLLGEVDCSAIRRGADGIAERLGSERFSAVVSSEKTLACFLNHDRSYQILYRLPIKATPSEAADDALFSINKAEAKRLDRKAKGENYYVRAETISIKDVERIMSILPDLGGILVDSAHRSPALEKSIAGKGIPFGYFSSPKTSDAPAEGSFVELTGAST